MTRAPPLSGRRHIFVTFAAAVSLWRFSVCAFVGLRIEGSMNACMELVGFSTSNKVKNHWSRRFLKELGHHTKLITSSARSVVAFLLHLLVTVQRENAASWSARQHQ